MKKEIKLSERLSGLELTVKDIVEIIADGYKIETMRFIEHPDSYSELRGMHINDGFSKEILVNSEQSSYAKRDTILHELYHAKFDKLGIKQNESTVTKLGRAHYNKLYDEDVK